MLHRIGGLATSLALVTGLGCANPDGRLDDFNDRVIDANRDRVDAEVLTTIPDISGRFLFALNPAPTPGAYFRFLATVELIDGTTDEPKISIEMQPLDFRTLAEVGDVINTVNDPVPVATTGEFQLLYEDIVIPAQANAASGTEIRANLVVDGVIRTEDEFCGTAEGGVIDPFTLSLNGSPFGSVRIPDGQGPADVELVAECREIDPPDAGVPDAMPPDAMPPDAMPADATPQDSAPTN